MVVYFVRDMPREDNDHGRLIASKDIAMRDDPTHKRYIDMQKNGLAS
jgi:hypothetical protein